MVPFSRFPAVVFNKAVVGSAGQGEVVDVGVAAVGPILGGVMHLAPVGREDHSADACTRARGHTARAAAPGCPAGCCASSTARSALRAVEHQQIVIGVRGARRGPKSVASSMRLRASARVIRNRSANTCAGVPPNSSADAVARWVISSWSPAGRRRRHVSRRSNSSARSEFDSTSESRASILSNSASTASQTLVTSTNAIELMPATYRAATDRRGDNRCRSTIFRTDLSTTTDSSTDLPNTGRPLTNDNQRVGSEAVFDDDARPSGHAALNDFPQRVRHLENRDVACEQAQVRRGEFRRKLSPYLAPLVDTQQH